MNDCSASRSTPFLQAYYLEEDAPPVVDLDKLSTDELKLSGYCVANPQEDFLRPPKLCSESKLGSSQMTILKEPDGLPQ
jgi:hypothetical protein